MKKILLIFFLFFALVLKSQVANDSVRSYNCNHDGAIFLEIVNLPQTITWYFEDELLGWIEADTMNDVYFNVSLDTLITQRCGSFKVNVGTTTKFYWISCQLGIRPFHQNVECFGDSTGMLKRVAHSGTPPYNYEWFKDGIAFSSGPLDTLHESLTTGAYKVIVSDSDSCQDSIIVNIASPLPIQIDTSIINNINCRGVNSGSITYSVSGGKKYTASESYNYYLIRNNDTIAWS
ncbi:MAG: SprB repeat-containing protein, partial [Flavobacteriales bacterium]|nr:SprB repeat-containing protein [Flavobacteriales bacterium]